jgi:hypothetical protein
MAKSVNAIEWGDLIQDVIEVQLKDGHEVVVDNFDWPQHGCLFCEIGKTHGFDLFIFTKSKQCTFIKRPFSLVYKERHSN